MAHSCMFFSCNWKLQNEQNFQVTSSSTTSTMDNNQFLSSMKGILNQKNLQTTDAMHLELHYSSATISRTDTLTSYLILTIQYLLQIHIYLVQTAVTSTLNAFMKVYKKDITIPYSRILAWGAFENSTQNVQIDLIRQIIAQQLH
jgi:hypothetical protein